MYPTTMKEAWIIENIREAELYFEAELSSAVTCYHCGSEIQPDDLYYAIFDYEICEDCIWSFRKHA